MDRGQGAKAGFRRQDPNLIEAGPMLTKTLRWRERTSHQLSSEKSRAITPRDTVVV
jgi:hypothetical protein